MFSKINLNQYLKLMLNKKPNAKSDIKGSGDYPKLRGNVYFYETTDGILLIADIRGLPHTPDACGFRVFGFHIHEGSQCGGNAQDPFADAGMHYNPAGCKHPQHAGDLPPLFENQGHAFMAFLTQRFTIQEIIGRTIIIHASPDDFTTQPAGSSGEKIACGVIKR